MRLRGINIHKSLDHNIWAQSRLVSENTKDDDHLLKWYNFEKGQKKEIKQHYI